MTAAKLAPAPLTIAMLPLRSVILDLEGVLSDSEPMRHRAINDVLTAHDRAPLTFDAFVAHLGVDDSAMWDDIVGQQHLRDRAGVYLDEFEDRLSRLFREHPALAPGARDLLGSLRRTGLTLAVVSTAREDHARRRLAALGIVDAFDAVVAADVAAGSLGAPSLHIRAARALMTPPAECIAVEDSPRGTTSAVEAGMLTAVVETSYTRHQPTGAAQLRVRDLDDLGDRLLSRRRATAGR
ncbi:MAG: hypothetical protein JWM34_1518 [Ilumatobacteraceae bacterium]|nr:hypothetical protein [Ilumatobacteraceae bacterium]